MRVVEFVDSWTQLDKYKNDWNRLWRRRPPNDQFYEYSWLKLNIALKEKTNGHPFCFVVKNDSGEVDAIYPFYYRKRPHVLARMPVYFNTLTFFPDGVSRPVHFLGTDSNEIDRLVAKDLKYRSRISKVEVFDMQGLTESSVAKINAVLSEAQVKVSKQESNEEAGRKLYDALCVSIPGTWSEYLANRKSQFRTNIRRAYKLIEDDHITLEVWRDGCDHTVDGAADMTLPELCEEIKNIEDYCWQKNINKHFGKYGPEHSIELLKTLEDNKALDIAFLYFNKKAVAFYLGTVLGSKSVCLFTAYHEDYKKYSPGILLLVEIIKQNIGNKRIDSINMGGAGGKDWFYKSRLADLRESTLSLSGVSNRFKPACFFFLKGVFN